VKKLLVVLVLLAACGYGSSQGAAWWNQQVNQPVSNTSQQVMVHVSQGETPAQLGRDLQAKHLIRSSTVFDWYVRYEGAGGDLQAGDFLLNRDMSIAQIVAALRRGRPATVRILLQEGETMQGMAEAAQQAGLGTAADYLAAASDLSWPYEFVRDRPATAPPNLQGFLFPDTYQLPRDATARDLVKAQLERFDQVVTPDMRQAAAQPVPGRPAEPLYTIVTLASIVEREVNKDPDRSLVCGVYYSRLAKGMPLGADATIQYAVGHQGLSDADLHSNSPYNTRTHPGLPPGPISNPGLASINAGLNPRPSPYLYYFTDTHGATHYARTLAEFNQQQAKFGVR
jgi:UPF0755 protein